ncbi:hypothetical protein M409DRAFT_19676 [Zasmidium cellare ATCC 36951]|uniref:Heterokaryon incompatibility domain-containing protein n=1 Tax=Zasmidium cellare ATCC 36951 TaxID=1080233 RepID=A0A6A6CV53_ZASCE|nr:uncharacterized protein M409DRAFT_19676 [Zasmidium cellare ATCC 36951]KAF2170068.1 hypothetical protein M409DRAFT_19676 [Zasmidium cellare ATCC 36951]
MADFCKVESNEYDQIQCYGCRAIGKLFLEQRRDETAVCGPILFHRSYQELAKCASRSRCAACQVIQRGLLLEQITVEEAVEINESQGAVYATVRKHGDDVLLEVTLEHTANKSSTATIICTSNHEITTNIQGVVNGADWKQLRGWLSGCDNKHSCRKYRWSNRNPSWLIQVLPRDRVRLIRGSDAGGPNDELVDYVALSYCWGNQKTISEKDPEGWERVKRAHTQVLAKDHPVMERLRPFPRDDYPETIRDAIKITEQLGLNYLWVDSICIPELSEWDVEATKMHEVYGNAYFTLFACSADKAIDPLFTPREAWKHPVKACRLYGYWLANRDPTLAEVRLQNPLSRRGWILQEERLSPRILFWCSQRAYWSCCERHATESRQSNLPTSPEQASNPPSRPQDFMMLSRSGESERMQEEWLDLVASYTRRNLAEQGKEKDRFKAISGLAIRYLSSSNQDAAQRNEYLAGLWRQSFARHLSWRVVGAVRPEEHLRSVAPTWSWASLPLSTEVNLRHEFQPTEHFTLLEPNHIAPEDTPADIVSKGALIKSVLVQGRLRKFISPDSIIVPWDAVMETHSGREVFGLPIDPDQSVHARSQDGRILVYEAHKAEVVGQLDYLEPEWVAEKGDVSVGWNGEMELWCLEVGQSAMLLLVRIEEDGDRYQRVGVAIGYRKNFFDGHEVKEMVLE